MLAGLDLPGGTGGEFAFELTETAGRIQFLVAVGLMSPLPCWLSAGSLSQPLKASCSPPHRLPSHSASAVAHWVLLTLGIFLTSPSATSTVSSQTVFPAFKQKALHLFRRASLLQSSEIHDFIVMISNFNYTCKVPFCHVMCLFTDAVIREWTSLGDILLPQSLSYIVHSSQSEVG